MDARITRQRLANMLSYDWLKILGAIALAAVFFCVFFLMIGVRPTDGQKFYVYTYNGLTAGGDFSMLENNLKENDVFGYDILDTGTESFKSGGLYGNSVFTARRSAGEGRVMFVNDVRTTNEDGSVSSALLDSFMENEGTPNERFGLFLDPEQFLADCKSYLADFFGENLDGEINHEKARETFLKRNAKDARFRSSSKKAAGVLLEEERLEKLKTDYLFVSASIGQELDYVTYTTEQKEHTIGFSMNSLNLTSLVFYTVEEQGATVKKSSDIALCIFNNGTREGDLRYESVNFLAYLLRTYGTPQ